jgi:DNA-binding transcriptional LysR family regulator
MTVINLEHEVELRHFAHFVAIAEEGSFIRERGRRLFERTTHHVRALIRGNRRRARHELS